ncbi:MAG: hypothetical protein AB8B65_09315, partial [Kordia sp.]|uniref:hypothetical protein n=1 Tax=Kordia sp. TaxID=1965332 RepID=UPI00385890D0
VSKWFAENVTISMQGNALRAVLMKSRQQGGSLPYRIQNPNIINCWFSGNTKVGETVTAINTDGLKIIGGGFTILENETENDPIGYFVPGVSLFVGKDYYYYDSNGNGIIDANDQLSDELLNEALGCANVHLDGVDLSNGIIKLGEKSYLTNIDCPFGRLEIAVIAKSPGKWSTTLIEGAHEGLKVTKQHTFRKLDFNDASNSILSRLKCPSPFGQASDPGGTSSNVIYVSSTNSYIPDDNYVKCFNCTQEIEMDNHAPTFDN